VLLVASLEIPPDETVLECPTSLYSLESVFTYQFCRCIFHHTTCMFGVHGVVVVKALRYKPAGRGFDSRWCHWNFSVT
jgi:hypothetical protein